MSTTRNKGGRRCAFLGATVALLTLAPGCSHHEAAPPPKGEKRPDAVDPQSFSVQRRDIQMQVVQPGTVQAYESTPIFSRINGYVEKYNVNIGDRVKVGDVLLTMWVPDLVESLNQKTAMVDRAKVEIRVAESSLRSAEATLENAKAHIVSSQAVVKRSQAAYTRWESEYNRLNQLVANQVLNSQVRDETYRQFEEAAATRDQSDAMVNEAVASRDRAAADLERARVDVESAKAELSVAEAERRQAQVLVDYGQIKASYDGVITQRNVSPGDYLQAGGGTGDTNRPLFVLEQTDPVRVFVGVPELAANFIKDGDTALVRIQAVAGALRAGKIVRTSFSLNPTTRTLQTEIDIPNSDGHLRPGMYVTVVVTVDRKQVFSVPSNAVIFVGGQNYALDLSINGKIIRTPVLVGPSDDQYTEILRKRPPGAPPEGWTMLDGDEVVVVNATKSGMDKPAEPAK
ncbi:efflux RND transporter periplasmic adaptor subunit [Paludisphaera rhizosphaerae]|uniref:efflux RND transporter periplasmic adaptor subunit n=1 Tax=Paludisphaera rhizosphaerae TaxID=2711216 RepID=UPI0013ECA909|nr:efflux RND transporter periplasmic adaptor subunit [Paludisphaera rhizosphaerae]